MINTKNDFYGKQEGENILYSIKPHPISLYANIIKVTISGLVVSSLGFIIHSQIPSLPNSIKTYPLLVGLIIAAAGIINLLITYQKTISYITNRRLVRFSAHTPFATSIRTLSWDQAVKAKTLPQNFILKMFMIGDITVHASSTVTAVDNKDTYNTVANDDIIITNAFYYKDLGNYIEKIIYTFKNEPEKIKDIKPFVEKPKGKRY